MGLIKKIAWIAIFFPLTPLIAQEETSALSVLTSRLEVIGSIRATNHSSDKNGIVMFKDSKDGKSIVVAIGRAFVYQNKTFILKGVHGKNVIISDGVNNAALSIAEGRYANAKEERVRAEPRESYGNEDYDADDEEVAQVDQPEIASDADLSVRTTPRKQKAKAQPAKVSVEDDEADEYEDD